MSLGVLSVSSIKQNFAPYSTPYSVSIISCLMNMATQHYILPIHFTPGHQYELNRKSCIPKRVPSCPYKKGGTLENEFQWMKSWSTGKGWSMWDEQLSVQDILLHWHFRWSRIRYANPPNSSIITSWNVQGTTALTCTLIFSIHMLHCACHNHLRSVTVNPCIPTQTPDENQVGIYNLQADCVYLWLDVWFGDLQTLNMIRMTSLRSSVIKDSKLEYILFWITSKCQIIIYQIRKWDWIHRPSERKMKWGQFEGDESALTLSNVISFWLLICLITTISDLQILSQPPLHAQIKRQYPPCQPLNTPFSLPNGLSVLLNTQQVQWSPQIGKEPTEKLPWAVVQ